MHKVLVFEGAIIMTNPEKLREMFGQANPLGMVDEPTAEEIARNDFLMQKDALEAPERAILILEDDDG